ncbi:MAG: glycosyltransferase family 4 protein [Bacteroidota bacterium]
MSKRICHISSVHPRTDIRIFLKECVSLAEAGNEVFLLVADGKGNAKINGVNIVDAGKLPSNRLSRMMNATKLIRKPAMELNCEVYHFHDPELIPLGLYLKKQAKKVVYDVHEDVPRQMLTKPYLNAFLRRLVANVFEKYENHQVKKFDAIVTSTPHIRNRFWNFNYQTVNVNNYPILSEFNIDPIAKRIPNQICYIGNISKERGILQLLEALEHTSATLVLAGTFETIELEKMAKEHAAWGQVRYVGQVDRAEIAHILSTSSVGMVTLLPALNYIDSLPIKMFEYMAGGVAIIASDFRIWKTIIEKEKCGICVNPMEVQGITQAIQHLISNPEIAKEMGNKGKYASQSKYNWTREKDKLTQLYVHL